MINLLIWLIVGGVIGWIASLIMGTNARQGTFLNVIVGIVGAAISGWLITPLLGGGTINQNEFSFQSLVISLIGGIILLGLINLLRTGPSR